MNIFALSPEEATKEIDKVLDGIPREQLIEELKACGLKVEEVKKMKLIDILNLIAKGELKEGTKVKLDGDIYVFKDADLICENWDETIFQTKNFVALDYEVEIIEPVCEHEWGDWEVRRVGRIGYYRQCEKCGKIEDVDHIGEPDKKVRNRIKEVDVEQFLEYDNTDRSRMLFDKLNEVIRELNRRRY